MNCITRSALFALLLCLLASELECASLFLAAISSALATIPFTAGPMTVGAGLAGAKLAVGSKLLYYLGFFGRRKSKKQKKVGLAGASAMGQGFGGGGGAFSMNQGFGGGAFPPKHGFGGGGAFPMNHGFGGGAFPGMMSALPLPYAALMAGGGGFPGQQQQFGGFGGDFGGGFGTAPQEAFQSPQGQFGGFDPAQLFQALAAQGIDPVMAMQAMGGGGGFEPSPQFFGNVPQRAGPQGFHQSQPIDGAFGKLPVDVSHSLPSSDNEVMPPQDGSGSPDDVESFFTFLRDMDDNTCISRLICEIGEDPSFLGEFSLNIDSIISSLDVSPSSGAYQYTAIMETGRKDGGCKERFPQCGDSAYEIVKSVAPSVGVPENINSATVNQL